MHDPASWVIQVLFSHPLPKVMVTNMEESREPLDLTAQHLACIDDTVHSLLPLIDFAYPDEQRKQDGFTPQHGVANTRAATTNHCQRREPVPLPPRW